MELSFMGGLCAPSTFFELSPDTPLATIPLSYCCEEKGDMWQLTHHLHNDDTRRSACHH